MRSQTVLGAVLFVVGLVLLYLLRGVVINLIVLVLGFLGVILAFALIIIGLAFVFSPRRRWRGFPM